MHAIATMDTKAMAMSVEVNIKISKPESNKSLITFNVRVNMQVNKKREIGKVQ